MIIKTLLLTMLAGVMNGSYATPVKYLKKWNEEKIWLIFSCMTFLLTPSLCLALVDIKIFEIVYLLPTYLLIIVSLAGLAFGVGIVLFTINFHNVGLGISFLVSISASTIISTLLPILLLNPSKLLSWFGLVELLALIFFGIAILISYFASRYKASQTKKTKSKKILIFGVILGIISGILTSAQGVSYVYTTTILKKKMTQYPTIAIMNAPWIPFFAATFIPFFIYFLYKCVTLKSFNNKNGKYALHYYPALFLMSILYFGSLIVFSFATVSMGQLGTAVGWPMFMIFIILTSNLWSIINGEWRNTNKKGILFLSCSLMSYILAISLLALASFILN